MTSAQTKHGVTPTVRTNRPHPSLRVIDKNGMQVCIHCHRPKNHTPFCPNAPRVMAKIRNLKRPTNQFQSPIVHASDNVIIDESKLPVNE